MDLHLITPAQRLEKCVTRLLEGQWRLIQLRGEPLSVNSIKDGEDIDCLCSQESVEKLARAAFDWARDGDCHFRIFARDRRKTHFTLISLDGSKRLELDLWKELWQIDRGRRCLTYDHCAAMSDVSEAVSRLPLNLELCVYIHHLASKRKDISSDSVAARLIFYRDVCRDNGYSVFLVEVEKILAEKAITDDTLAQFLLPLESAVTLLPGPCRFNKLLDQSLTVWIGMPRRIRTISLMGCDGAGKSTLSQRLAANKLTFSGVFTGKHLYRKSLLYKFGVIFLRPVLFQSREKYDETLAPLLYLRGALGLWLKLLRNSKRILLIDRTLMDFLMINRKTDKPVFSPFSWLSHSFGHRIPVIHCVLSYETLHERKNEITCAGHDAYDVLMFVHHSKRIPTDYCIFHNGGNLEESVAALLRIIAWMKLSN